MAPINCRKEVIKGIRWVSLLEGERCSLLLGCVKEEEEEVEEIERARSALCRAHFCRERLDCSQIGAGSKTDQGEHELCKTFNERHYRLTVD